MRVTRPLQKVVKELQRNGKLIPTLVLNVH